MQALSGGRHHYSGRKAPELVGSMNDVEEEVVIDDTEKKMAIALLLSIILSFSLSAVFAVLATRFRYDHALMDYLAVWFSIVGVQLLIVVGLDWAFYEIARYAYDEKRRWKREFISVALDMLLIGLPVYFVVLEPMFFKGIGPIARYMNIALIILMFFFLFMVVADFANKD